MDDRKRRNVPQVKQFSIFSLKKLKCKSHELFAFLASNTSFASCPCSVYVQAQGFIEALCTFLTLKRTKTEVKIKILSLIYQSSSTKMPQHVKTETSNKKRKKLKITGDIVR